MPFVNSTAHWCSSPAVPKRSIAPASRCWRASPTGDAEVAIMLLEEAKVAGIDSADLYQHLGIAC